MSRVHSLKITDGWWRVHCSGDKLYECATIAARFFRPRAPDILYELRRNDRDFRSGDIARFTDLLGNYRGRARITYVLRDLDGLADGYVIFGVQRLYSYEAVKDEPERGDVDERVEPVIA